jgi:hypothetical protein
MSHHHEVKEPVGWMDRPEAVKRLFMIFYVICGALFAAELVLMGTENAHPHPLEERMRIFVYPVYGFVSFWFLVLVARPMRALLIRSEDYYDRADDGSAGVADHDAARHQGGEGDAE